MEIYIIDENDHEHNGIGKFILTISITKKNGKKRSPKFLSFFERRDISFCALSSFTYRRQQQQIADNMEMI